MDPLLQHRALCPSERDTPAPPWVTLLLHPTPYLCPATLHACGRPPKRHHNGGHGVSKRRKCPSAGGQGSDLRSRLLFGALPWMCLVTLSMTPQACPCPRRLPCRGCFWSSLSLPGCLYSDLHNRRMIFSSGLSVP